MVSLLQKISVVLLLCFSVSVDARVIQGFNGPYSSENWIVSTNDSFGFQNRIEVLTIDSDYNKIDSSDQDNVFTYETVAAATGTVSFDSLSQGFAAEGEGTTALYDFFVLINGQRNLIGGGDGFLFEGASVIHTELLLTKGETFGFMISTPAFPRNLKANTFIFNFRAVPEPSVLALLALGAFSLSINRRRKLS